jgi:hypothetical protein
MSDPKWIEDFSDREADEAVKMATGKTNGDLPEAPISITVKGYFKGFSALFTKRLDGDRLIPQIDGVVQLIDQLLLKGFEPSWNVDTNKAMTSSKPADLGVCKDCGAPNAWSEKKQKVYCSKTCWIKK